MGLSPRGLASSGIWSQVVQLDIHFVGHCNNFSFSKWLKRKMVQTSHWVASGRSPFANAFHHSNGAVAAPITTCASRGCFRAASYSVSQSQAQLIRRWCSNVFEAEERSGRPKWWKSSQLLAWCQGWWQIHQRVLCIQFIVIAWILLRLWKISNAQSSHSLALISAYRYTRDR